IAMCLEASDSISCELSNLRTQFLRKQIELLVNIELDVSVKVHVEVNRKRHVERPPRRDAINLVAREGSAPLLILLKSLNVEKVLVKSHLGALDGLPAPL